MKRKNILAAILLSTSESDIKKAIILQAVGGVELPYYLVLRNLLDKYIGLPDWAKKLPYYLVLRNPKPKMKS